MKFDSIESVRSAGFGGFRTANELRSSGMAGVPPTPGVYMVVYEPEQVPVFEERSCGGHFKGKDPTVSIDELKRNWVEGTPVVYIGKAGGGSSAATLKKRLTTFVRFGAGEPVGHWGGRLIWQLQEANSSLRFCWRPADTGDAAVIESELIQEFVAQFGARPFANLRN